MTRTPIFLGLLAALFSSSFNAPAQPEAELGGFKLSQFPGQGEPPSVRLIDPGSEQRRELRYRFEVGSTHHMVMTMRMSLAMKMNGQDLPSTKAPGIKLPLIIQIAEAEEAGVRYEFSVPEAPELVETEGIQPQLIESIREGLRGFTSFRGHAVVTDRAVTKSAHFELGEDANPGLAQMLESMKQSVSQMSIPLPEQAVGVGARWKTLQRMQTSGMTIYQVGTFSLLQVDGAVLNLEIGLEMFAPQQDLDLPDLPAGASARLAAMSGNGEGRMTVDLRSPVPDSSLSMETESIMNINVAGSVQHTEMKMGIEMQIEPGKRQ